MADQTKQPDLWTPRSVADTQRIYADWADTYEDDVTAMAYATPARVAQALADTGDSKAAAVLDFGCGTGLSGLALAEQGFGPIDGTDISEAMLAHATQKALDGVPVYRRLWVGTPGRIDTQPGDYSAIVATGVISLGAAPPEMLAVLLQALAPGGLLVISYNDPTLENQAYVDALDAAQTEGLTEVVFREHGPHLNASVTGSDVIVLRRL